MALSAGGLKPPWWERLWFVLLSFTFGLTLTWLYFWWEVRNDYDEFNWYLYNHMGYWSDWSVPILVTTAAAFTYIAGLLVLALCHIAVGQQMSLHWLHKGDPTSPTPTPPNCCMGRSPQLPPYETAHALPAPLPLLRLTSSLWPSLSSPWDSFLGSPPLPQAIQDPPALAGSPATVLSGCAALFRLAPPPVSPSGSSLQARLALPTSVPPAPRSGLGPYTHSES
uniref:Glycerophosphodiester phosphodiesterase domain containing 5 n=1 Tax=Ursus maritimus TaxID=29073 RepID=A0A452U251_URSMA